MTDLPKGALPDLPEPGEAAKIVEKSAEEGQDTLHPSDSKEDTKRRGRPPKPKKATPQISDEEMGMLERLRESRASITEGERKRRWNVWLRAQSRTGHFGLIRKHGFDSPPEWFDPNLPDNGLSMVPRKRD